jgi:hypothetical protein
MRSLKKQGVIVGAIIRLARVAVGVAEPLRPYLELMGPPDVIDEQWWNRN